jgi:hypothetical protein
MMPLKFPGRIERFTIFRQLDIRHTPVEAQVLREQLVDLMQALIDLSPEANFISDIRISTDFGALISFQNTLSDEWPVLVPMFNAELNDLEELRETAIILEIFGAQGKIAHVCARVYWLIEDLFISASALRPFPYGRHSGQHPEEFMLMPDAAKQIRGPMVWEGALFCRTHLRGTRMGYHLNRLLHAVAIARWPHAQYLCGAAAMPNTGRWGFHGLGFDQMSVGVHWYRPGFPRLVEADVLTHIAVVDWWRRILRAQEQTAATTVSAPGIGDQGTIAPADRAAAE